MTGEDWSEKIASELASLIDLPAAAVELAKCQDQRGIVTFDFTRELSESSEHRKGAQGWTEIGHLVHGNELLLKLVGPYYPAEQTYRVPDHTVDRVFDVLERPEVLPPPDLDGRRPGLSAAGVFVGYLLLDAWIGNTDRHHGNWAVIDLRGKPTQRLSPTYDHASSLGRELQEQELSDRVTTHDRNRTVEAYLKNKGARSALYRNTDDKKPMHPLKRFNLPPRDVPRLASSGDKGWQRSIQMRGDP